MKALFSLFSFLMLTSFGPLLQTVEAADPNAALRASFRQADRNNDGFIDTAEHQQQLQRILQAMDRNRDGEVDSREAGGAKEFATLDRNRDGRITVSELMEIDEGPRFKAADVNNDAKLTVDELIQYNSKDVGRASLRR